MLFRNPVASVFNLENASIRFPFINFPQLSKVFDTHYRVNIDASLTSVLQTNIFDSVVLQVCLENVYLFLSDVFERLNRNLFPN